MNKAVVLAGVIVGIAIGYNWPRIRKATAPAMRTVEDTVSGAVVEGMRFMVQIKESIEDRLAERRARQALAEATAEEATELKTAGTA